ncbi:hypothetical protein Pint_16933 [Pistacia integerrima]|uniref:Uncharacterized protein n=1 Tax=Pistacia integerrima TaxID=434235 RepID=A0ACC0ZEN5_9ROSI|nr:hypothetical protein Pint_16933 [Pistacia integerrima]
MAQIRCVKMLSRQIRNKLMIYTWLKIRREKDKNAPTNLYPIPLKNITNHLLNSSLTIFKTQTKMADQSEKPEVFELNNGSMHVKISNFGAIILSLSLPDKQGNLADVALGFDSIEPYVVNFLSFLNPF